MASDQGLKDAVGCYGFVGGVCMSVGLGLFLCAHYEVTDSVTWWLVMGVSVLLASAPGAVVVLLALILFAKALVPLVWAVDWINRPSYADDSED